MHNADGDYAIERNGREWKPIAIVSLIGNAGVALAISRRIDASERESLIGHMGMAVADPATDIEQVDLRWSPKCAAKMSCM